MNIAIILGRGIEGCGVTRYALESKKWHEAKGHTVTIFASTDKQWGRKKAQVGEFIEFSNSEIPELAIKIDNEFDLVYYQSLPSVSHSQEFQDLFLDHLVLKVNKPIKVSFQNDHKPKSIHRNANIFDITKQMDGAFIHSFGAPFANMLKERNIDTPLLKMGVGFDFDELKPYWKTIDDQLDKITFFGRFATFKQPKRMYEMHEFTKEAGIINELHGIERSFGSLKFFYENEKDRENTYRKMLYEVKENKSNEPEVKTPDHVYVYGPYIREEGLEMLSHSAFGSDFYRLDAKAYGDNFEYSMCEIIGVGSIPVFDIHWAKHCRHNDGRLFIDIKDFAIYHDENNPQDTVDQMKHLLNNPVERNKRRETCFEIAKSHCGTEVVFQNQWDQVEALEKRKKPLIYKSSNLF